MNTQNKYLPFLMWLLPLSFFTYQFILRLWPGLMMNQIREQFDVDATTFGLLTAVYYYGYASMQIPVAIILDKFSARYTVFIFAIICGLSAIIFNYTDNLYLAYFSRLLIGVGSAAGFLGVSKVVSEWFPKEQYTRMIGFSFTIGLIGAIYGGKPLGLLTEKYNWHNIALVLSLISIIIGFSVYLLLRTPKNVTYRTNDKPFNLLLFKDILSSPIMWFLAIANLLMVGSLEGFADVWGVSYLMTVYNLSKTDAAGIISFIFVGMICGGPVLALLSERFGNYTVISGCGVGMAGIFIQLLFNNAYYNWYLLALLLFLVGVMCCYQVIVFAVGSNIAEARALGVTIAFLNCINMLGGSFFHTSIGYIMDLFWTGVINNDGARVYTIESYRYALSMIPICAIIGALIVGVIGLNTKCANKRNLSAL